MKKGCEFTLDDNQTKPISHQTRTRTRVTKDGLEAEKVYDYNEPCYSEPVTTIPERKVQKKKGIFEK